MLIGFLDTETTGLSQEKGAKIIELALIRFDMNTRKPVHYFIQRFDPQQPIEASAQEVHGIAYTDLVGCPTWEEMADDIYAQVNGNDLIVAHNMAFDGTFIAGELLRVGKSVTDVHSFCTMENARWACPDGKLPKLGELCFALGVDYDVSKAHAAQYDVEVMAECFFRGLDRGFYELPKGLVEEERKVA